MYKIEKKLRKIKGLYKQLSIKNGKEAIEKAKNDNMHWDKLYVEFDFEYSIKYSSIALNVYKSTVRYGYDKRLEFRIASGLDYYNLMDVMFYGENFEDADMKRLNEYVEYLTKFVRKALKDGMESMAYSIQTEHVKVSNYLDFEEKY